MAGDADPQKMAIELVEEKEKRAQAEKQLKDEKEKRTQEQVRVKERVKETVQKMRDECASRINEKEKALAEAKKDLEAANARADAAQQASSVESNAAASATSAATEELRQKVAELEAKVEAAERHREAAEKQSAASVLEVQAEADVRLAKVTQEREQLLSDKVKVEQDRDGLKVQLQQLEGQVHSLKEQAMAHDATAKQAADREQRHRQVETELQESNQKLRTTEEELEETKKHALTFDAAKAASTLQEVDFASQRQEFETESRVLREQSSTFEKQQQQVTQEMEQLVLRHAEELRSVKDQVESSAQVNGSRSEEYKTLEQHRDELEEELQAARSQTVSLEEARKFDSQRFSASLSESEQAQGEQSIELRRVSDMLENASSVGDAHHRHVTELEGQKQELAEKLQQAQHEASECQAGDRGQAERLTRERDELEFELRASHSQSSESGEVHSQLLSELEQLRLQHADEVKSAREHAATEEEAHRNQREELERVSAIVTEAGAAETVHSDRLLEFEHHKEMLQEELQVARAKAAPVEDLQQEQQKLHEDLRATRAQVNLEEQAYSEQSVDLRRLSLASEESSVAEESHRQNIAVLEEHRQRLTAELEQLRQQESATLVADSFQTEELTRERDHLEAELRASSSQMVTSGEAHTHLLAEIEQLKMRHNEEFQEVNRSHRTELERVSAIVTEAGTSEVAHSDRRLEFEQHKERLEEELRAAMLKAAPVEELQQQQQTLNEDLQATRAQIISEEQACSEQSAELRRLLLLSEESNAAGERHQQNAAELEQHRQTLTTELEEVRQLGSATSVADTSQKEELTRERDRLEAEVHTSSSQTATSREAHAQLLSEFEALKIRHNEECQEVNRSHRTELERVSAIVTEAGTAEVAHSDRRRELEQHKERLEEELRMASLQAVSAEEARKLEEGRRRELAEELQRMPHEASALSAVGTGQAAEFTQERDIFQSELQVLKGQSVSSGEECRHLLSEIEQLRLQHQQDLEVAREKPAEAGNNVGCAGSTEVAAAELEKANTELRHELAASRGQDSALLEAKVEDLQAQTAAAQEAHRQSAEDLRQTKERLQEELDAALSQAAADREVAEVRLEDLEQRHADATVQKVNLLRQAEAADATFAQEAAECARLRLQVAGNPRAGGELRRELDEELASTREQVAAVEDLYREHIRALERQCCALERQAAPSAGAEAAFEEELRLLKAHASKAAEAQHRQFQELQRECNDLEAEVRRLRLPSQQGLPQAGALVNLSSVSRKHAGGGTEPGSSLFGWMGR